MKVLAIERSVPGAEESRFTPEILAEEAEKAWELHQAGIVRELYFTAETHEAVLVLEAAGSAEAARHLEGLPLVRAGLIAFEITPLIAYPGFERLFARNQTP